MAFGDYRVKGIETPYTRFEKQESENFKFKNPTTGKN